MLLSSLWYQRVGTLQRGLTVLMEATRDDLIILEQPILQLWWHSPAIQLQMCQELSARIDKFQTE